MTRKTVEIQFSSNDLRETFLAWIQEDGAEMFEDWVLNFCDGIEGVNIDFELVDSAIIVMDEE